jgi:hypothetical protein
MIEYVQKRVSLQYKDIRIGAIWIDIEYKFEWIAGDGKMWRNQRIRRTKVDEQAETVPRDKKRRCGILMLYEPTLIPRIGITDLNC